MNRGFEIGDNVICRTSGVTGTVLRFYTPTSCAEQTLVRTRDGRKYHAPTSEWVKVQTWIEIANRDEQKNLAKKLGSTCAVLAVASMNNSLGEFVRNQINIAKRFEEKKFLKRKFENEKEELE